MSSTKTRAEPSSFRDPSGTVFWREGKLYRQVNHSFAEEFEHIRDSGLYDALVEREMLVPHELVKVAPLKPDLAHAVIRPEEIAFISYPFEWSFSQLKDAALLTLRAQRLALEHGMILKDASAFNVQFRRGKPILIDSLSFGMWTEGRPWDAYRQFCQHFLAPLALISYRSPGLGLISRVFLDGIPLELTAGLLPLRSRLSFGLLVHLHLHAGAQRRYRGESVDSGPAGRRMSKQAMQGFAESLGAVVKSLEWESRTTDWAGYGSFHNYSEQAMQHKRRLVQDYLQRAQPDSVWDLGANTGEFSRIAASLGANTIAFDSDPGAVETAYLAVKRDNSNNLLPLVLDLTNPTPALGWALSERQSLVERGPTDMILALALIHHLVIANNIPMQQLAEFFSLLARWIVVEFVPKEDPQIEKLLMVRRDIFADYNQLKFEEIFGGRFQIESQDQVGDSGRTLYLMKSLAG